MMMKQMTCLLFAAIMYTAAHAQLPDALTKAKSGIADAAAPGKLLTQFAGALETTSLLSSFAPQKAAWLTKAGKVADAVGMAQSVASLAGGIKPAMFKNGFNVNNLIQMAGTVKTFSGAGSLLSSLQGGLKPEALSSSWASQKPAWESALSLLK